MGVTSFFGGIVNLFKVAFLAPLTKSFEFVTNYAGSGDITSWSYGDHATGRALAAPSL